MKFTRDRATRFGWEGLQGRAYNSRKEFGRASAAYLKVTKSHGKVKSSLSDRVYYVISGSGKFVLNGKETGVKKTDVIIVPRNTPYNYMGRMELFLVHLPAYDERYEKKI